MNLQGLLAELVRDLAQAHPGLSVKAHGGRFDLNELDSYAVTAPELRVTLLAAARNGPRRQQVELSLAVYIVSGRDRHWLAHERGQIIAGQLLAWLANAQPARGEPQDVRYSNLFSEQTRERNKHLGAVSWRQVHALEALEATPPLADFRSAICQYAPVPDAPPLAADEVRP